MSNQNKNNRRKRIRRLKLKTASTIKKITAGDKAKYYQYLKSAVWNEKRKFALEFYGNRCGLCGSRYDLEIHHRTYKNIFKEPMEDLMILCESCHRHHHKGQVWKNGKESKYMRNPNSDKTPTTYYPDRKINQDVL